MLARLQQALTLGALLLATVWVAACLATGHPSWALMGAACVLGGHALVLGLEFVLLHRVHGADPTPRARPAALLKAWWGEVLSAPQVFCWRQPFHSQRWPDLLPVGAQGRRGVVFVHGFVCNRGLWNPWLQQMTAQHTPFLAVNLEPVFGTIDDYADIIEAAVRQVQACTGLPPVIVAHSMGGLAVRAWWALHEGDERVHHCITIGTPHQGTWLARFAMTMNARQMRLQSPWLLGLAGGAPADRAARFTCFYSHCDNIVFPAATATLPGADNRHLPGVAHVHMADRPEPMAELQRWLQPAL
jgi:triacylglycerol esterase/lipase EstA (alpha/beta hydrolase family)